MAIPRLADEIGVTPRVLRYWEEQGLVSPTREHGKLRFSPRDLAIARLVKRLLDAGVGIDGIKMLKAQAERGIRDAGAADDERRLLEIALGILYARKAFREERGMDEEHFPDGRPPPPPHGPGHGPGLGPRHAPPPPPPPPER